MFVVYIAQAKASEFDCKVLQTWLGGGGAVQFVLPSSLLLETGITV